MSKILIDRAVLEQALEALSLALSDVDWRKDSPTQPVIHKAYNATRAALEQPQVEQPVAWAVMQGGAICWETDYPFSNEPGWCDSDQQSVPLYTHPQPPRQQPQVTQETKSYKVTGKTGEFCVFHSTEVKRGDMVYTHPQPQRQPLTDEQITDLWIKHARSGAYIHAFARAIERAHGIGGET